LDSQNRQIFGRFLFVLVLGFFKDFEDEEENEDDIWMGWRRTK